MSLAGRCSKKTLRRINAMKTFLSVDKPVSKRGAMYTLLSMGELSSTKDFHNFNRALNRALESGSLCDEHFDDDCFVDNQRIASQRISWENLTDFKQWCSSIYHRSPWQEQSECVEVWLEKRTLIPLVEDVTRKFDVMLRASAGNFSRTFLYRAAQHLGGSNVPPLTILYIGDFDPSGLDIERTARSGLEGFLGHNNFSWLRLGVTEEEYANIAVKARVSLKEDGSNGKQRGDPRAAKFKAQYGDYGVEVEALEVAEVGGLARRLEAEIHRHIDATTWEESQESEASDKRLLSEGNAA